MLELAYANLDHVDVWFYAEDRLVSAYETGDSLPFLTRPIEHRNFLFPNSSPTGPKLTLILRVASTTSLQLPLTLWPQDVFYRNDQRLQLIQGMFFGIMLVMAIYNFFIYLVIRERAYLFYVLFVTMEGSYQAFHQGIYLPELMVRKYLVAFRKWWYCDFIDHRLCRILFHRDVGLRRIKSRWVRFFDTVGAIGVGVAACSLILEYSWTARSASLLAIVAAVGIMTAGVQRWRDGFRPAKHSPWPGALFYWEG